MRKIAHIADLHISGAWLDRSRTALEQVANICNANNVRDIVFSGDIFERSNIADRFASIGDQQTLLAETMTAFTDGHGASLKWLIEGNHDRRGTQKSALSILESMPSVTTINKPLVWPSGGILTKPDIVFGFIPWIQKGEFVSKNAVGDTKSEADLKFSEAITAVLAKIKQGFDEAPPGMPKILFGHCEVQGVSPNPGYTIQGGGFAFTEGQLKATGADYISLGHIHKRGGLYAGSLYQKNFGEEGNPQGFEIITVSGSEITQEWHSIDLPEYKTLEITGTGFEGPWNYADGDIVKIRFMNESAYNGCPKEILNDANVTIERCWTKKEFVARTETALAPTMTDHELLQEYIKINPMPDGITETQIMEVAQ